MWSNDPLGPVANSPTMSSKRKKAESMASNIMILVDFDGAISTEAGSQWRWIPFYLAFSVLDMLWSVLGALGPY